MYANLTILRTYAARMDPAEIPPTIRLCHTEDSVTVFDRWPKGRFHFLLLPRARPEAGLHERHLRDLHAILSGLPREDARALLLRCRADAQEVLAHIRAEMVRAEGFAWGVQVGFHAVPSLEYVTSSMKHLTCVFLGFACFRPCFCAVRAHWVWSFWQARAHSYHVDGLYGRGRED